jgi:hypothetical protein
MATTTVYAIESAMIDSANPGSNYSSGNDLNLLRRNNTFSQSNPYSGFIGKIALIKFNTASLQKKRITSVGNTNVFLRSLNDIPYYGHPMWCFSILEHWAESTATYNNKPNIGEAVYIPPTPDENAWFSFQANPNMIINGLAIIDDWYGYSSPIIDTILASSRDSSRVPYADVTYENILAYPSNIYPTGGAIDDTIDNTFYWTFAYDQTNVIGTIEQSNAQIEWKNTEGTIVTHTINVSGGAQNVMIPGGTFPTSSAFEWRIRLQSNDGIWGNWSTWYTISTVDNIQRTCENLSPNMAYVDASSINKFEWISASEIGTGPTGFDLQLSEDGDTWNLAANIMTEDDYYDMPAGTLTAAIKYWRVRSYNSDGVAGIWSNPAQIVVISKPDKPTILSVSLTNMPLIKWASSGQQGYEIQIVNSTDIVYKTDIKAGIEKELKILYPIINGNYSIRLRIVNEYELLSDWEEYAVTINTMPTTEIKVIGSGGVYKNKLSWEASIETFTYRIMRDGYFIAETEETQFEDYTACGEHEYFIRIIEDQVISDSNKIKLKCSPDCVVIAPAKTPDQILLCKYSSERAGQTYTPSKSVNLVHISGRKLPVSIQGEFFDFIEQINYVEIIEANRWKLRDMHENGTIFIFRDQYKNKYFVEITAMNIQPIKQLTYYTFTIQAVDYQDFIGEYFEGYSLLVANYEKFFVRDEE